MPGVLIHVRSDETGNWSVEPEDREAPVSRYNTETDAERDAIARAAALDDAAVVIHDRYTRVRIVHVAHTRR